VSKEKQEVTTTSAVRAVSLKRAHRRQAMIALGFVLPMFLLFLAFRFGPFLAGAALSFGSYNLGDGFSFEGTKNYQQLIEDPLFWQALRVTAIYTIVVVPLTLGVATAMAVLVRREFRGVRFFRSIFFLPVITSLVLAGVVFIWIFNGGGPVPSLLAALGWNTGSWLSSSVLAIPAVAIVSVWGRFGFDMLIVLARLQDVPRDLEEAAMIDGAGPWQRFRHVILPELRPVFFFLLVIETIGSFQVFDAVYVMTGGGPANATYTLGFMLYDQAFQFFDFGYASAVAMALFVIVLVLSIVQRVLLDREDA